MLNEPTECLRRTNLKDFVFLGKEENSVPLERPTDLWQQAERCACDGQRGIVYLCGVPRDMLDLWQQARRCAHNGQRGIVFLYGVPRDMLDLWQQAGQCAHDKRRKSLSLPCSKRHA